MFKNTPTNKDNVLEKMDKEEKRELNLFRIQAFKLQMAAFYKGSKHTVYAFT